MTIFPMATQCEEIGYDRLQNVFSMLSFDTTEDDLIKWIQDNELEYIAQKYNGRPKKMKYNDE